VRLRRLLVMLPWLMERGSATLTEMAQRFQISEKELITDLEQAAMCGLPPFVDEFIDLFIDDGVVTVGVPRFFTRPLRLTSPEGFALLMAGRAALA
jgi:proteasome accessory factor C